MSFINKNTFCFASLIIWIWEISFGTLALISSNVIFTKLTTFSKYLTFIYISTSLAVFRDFESISAFTNMTSFKLDTKMFASTIADLARSSIILL